MVKCLWLYGDKGMLLYEWFLYNRNPVVGYIFVIV